jgi:hypothetical protein
LDKIDRNAKRKTENNDKIIVDNDFIRRNFANPTEPPIIIASTDAIGTVRAKCNNLEAILDYYMEEEALKAAGAPIFPVRIR